MSKEYIEREALLKKSETMHDGQRCCLAVREGYIYTAPAADVVEVVRCKDCKFFIPDSELDHNEYPNIIEADGLCDNSLKFTDADDYCSYGERKEV